MERLSLNDAPVSLEALHTEYKKQKQLVRGLAAYKKHMKQLDTQLTNHPNIEASHALCLGLGPFTKDDTFSDSLKQLITFEDVIKHLKFRHRIAEPTHVYFQDPDFSTLDSQFLTSLGHQVIPYPLGGALLSMHTFKGEARECADILKGPRQLELTKKGVLASANYITENTFLYAPNLPWMVITQAFAVATPSLYLGNYIIDMDTTKGHLISKARSFMGKDGISPDELKTFCKGLKISLDALDWQKPMLYDMDDYVWQDYVWHDNVWHDNVCFAFAKVPEDWVLSAEERDQPSKDIPTWKADQLKSGE